jgi:hypothetical protein
MSRAILYNFACPNVVANCQYLLSNGGKPSPYAININTQETTETKALTSHKEARKGAGRKNKPIYYINYLVSCSDMKISRSSPLD